MAKKNIKKQAPWFITFITTVIAIMAPIGTHLIDKKHETKKIKAEHAFTLKQSNLDHLHSTQGYKNMTAEQTARIKVLTDELALAQRWEGMYNHVISIAASRCPPRSIFDAENLMCTPTKRPHH